MGPEPKTWKVELTDEAQALLTKLIRSGRVGKEDIKILRIWTEQMMRFGPESIRQASDWRDHDLEAEWAGHRASSFSFSGRIIYRVIESKILVEVVRVTPDHNYKKE